MDIGSGKQSEPDVGNEAQTKEAELHDLKKGMANFRSLMEHEGWKTLEGIFIRQSIQIRDEIMENAILLQANNRNLDGLQGMQLEAMRKGQVAGVMAVLRYPSSFIAQALESVEMLEKAVAMKEETDAG